MKSSTLALAVLPLVLVPVLRADTTPAPGRQPAPQSPANAQACSQLKALDAAQKSSMQALNAQLKTLEEQRKALGETSRAQRYALMNQIVPGSGDARKAFDDQVKALEETEKQEIKPIREKYAETRKGMKPPQANLHCR